MNEQIDRDEKATATFINIFAASIAMEEFEAILGEAEERGLDQTAEYQAIEELMGAANHIAHAGTILAEAAESDGTADIDQQLNLSEVAVKIMTEVAKLSTALNVDNALSA